MSDKLKIFEAYLKSGINPILLEGFDINLFNDAVIIDSTLDISKLEGHYDGISYLPPDWYINLVNKNNPILLINNINSISTNEQKKFIEILKYKKISTFNLPKNCIILVTSDNSSINRIDEEVYSLLAVV